MVWRSPKLKRKRRFELKLNEMRKGTFLNSKLILRHWKQANCSVFRVWTLMWWQQPTHRPLICYLRWTIRWPGTWRLCRCNSWSGGSSPSRWRPVPRRSRCTSSRFRTRCRSTGQWWTWWREKQSLRRDLLSVLNDSAWLQHIFHTGFTIPVWFNFNYRLHSNINQFSIYGARSEQHSAGQPWEIEKP